MEKIFKREDGTKIKVKVSFFGVAIAGNLYGYEVHKAEKGKRKYTNVVNSDDFKYRSMSMEEREAYRQKENMKYITKVELLHVLDLLHASFKPTIRNTTA